MNGFILVDKEKGMTSNDVVRKVKKIIGMKKVGHSGTLDPDTTGLVVVGLGRATKMFPIISTEKQKTYISEITLGILTDTLDMSGTVLEEQLVPEFSMDKLNEICKSFIGNITQTPPIYSAKKVNGKRLYEYARNGEKVEYKDHNITIYSIKILNVKGNKIKFEAVVGKGTYIRSLVLDIAKKLGTVGTMSELVRTQTDGFDVLDAKKLDDINIDDIIHLDEYCLNKYNAIEVYGPVMNLIKNGAQLRIRSNIVYPCLYVDRDTKKCIGIYDIIDNNTGPILMF